MLNRFEVFPCKTLYFSSISENRSFCWSTTLKGERYSEFNTKLLRQEAKKCVFPYQLRTPHAASDSKHRKVLKSNEVLWTLFFPASVFSFWASFFPFELDVSDTSSVGFCDFFLCFTSVGILANDALLVNLHPEESLMAKKFWQTVFYVVK